jgi:hypothetical protein
MPLTAGQALSFYEILGSLGAALYRTRIVKKVLIQDANHE